MVDLVEEALGEYFGWNTMTEPELDELNVYKLAERRGPGIPTVLPPFELRSVSQRHREGGCHRAAVNETERRSLPTDAGYLSGTRSLRLRLEVDGRIRHQNLQARRTWEQRPASSSESSAASPIT